MAEEIPVNPEILRWARATAGLSTEAVAAKLSRKKITAETVAAWEKGAASPTYPQLERLAYEIYKRPLALFFFPEAPQEETPNQSFRSLPDEEIRHLPPRLLYLLRQARAMQLNVAELYDEVNPATQQVVRDLSFTPHHAVSEMATVVREYLGVELATQCQWGTPEEAFKEWRAVLETHGVFIFKEAIKDAAFSGFCLYDAHFPVIYVNNSKPATRQIFTLFHELAHLVFGTGGIDTRLEDYLEFLHGDARRIEVACNRFAGEFLVPHHDFNRRIEGATLDDETVGNLASRYGVSREVILRKLLDRGLVGQEEYERKAAAWAAEVVGRTKGEGNYYRTKGAYLGERYLEVAFSRYYQERISREQLAGYLGVKTRNIPGMEALLFHKGAAA
jgi:Zn-dependent peptidase ImmA (M78 family)